MRSAACLIGLLALGACEDEIADTPDARWTAIEKDLGDGVAAARRRRAAEAVPSVQRALDALQDLIREEWAALLTFAPPGWAFFKPNIQASTTKAGPSGEIVGEITGTVNGRREADGTIVIVYVSSSPAHVDSHRQLYANAGKLEAMRRTMDVETETRAGLLIARRIYKMRSETIVMGDHTVLTVTIAKEDKALLRVASGWIDLDLFKRLDAATGLSRAK